MGLESANYQFVPSSSPSSHVLDVLKSLGAVEATSSARSYKDFILSGESHWIDLRIGTFSSEKTGDTLSIRVALCNPDSVGPVLLCLFQKLLHECGGHIFDKDARVQYSDADDASWQRLWRDYQARRETFRKMFGNIEAVISGDDFFKFLESRKGSL